MASDNKLDRRGLTKVWEKVFALVKTLTGEVDIVGKGTLQEQIDNIDTEGKGAVEISWGDYCALSEEEKNNGTLWAIYDAPFVTGLAVQAMTMEMYEALSDEEKMDNTVRFISDATFMADGENVLEFSVVDGILVVTYDDGTEEGVEE